MILSIIISVVLFLLILSIVVIIHELGHYLVAKKLGIKVEEFGFGFPPRVWGKKIGETVYSLNLLPLGGFVKLYGEDPAGGGRPKIRNSKFEIRNSDLKRAFFARPAWQRASVIVAGVVMNLLLSFVIFYIFLFASGFKSKLPLIIPNNFLFANQSVSQSVYAGLVEKNSPAQAVGLMAGDKLLEVDGIKVSSDDVFRNEVNKNRGKKIFVKWQKIDGQNREATIIPRINPPKGQGAIGIGLFGYSEVEVSYDTPIQRLFSGITYPINLLVYNLRGISHIVGTSVHQKNIAPVSENVSGPLGIFVVVGTVVASSPNVRDLVLQGLNIIGLISISLAFFNVLPIPALDGGRLFFVLIEMLTRKKINPNHEAAINNVAFIVLLGLVVLISIFFDLPKLSNFLGFLNR